MTILLDEIVNLFHVAGHVIIQDLLQERELHQVGLEIDKVLSGERYRFDKSDIFIEDDRTTIRQLESLQKYAEFFAEFSQRHQYHELFKSSFSRRPFARMSPI